MRTQAEKDKNQFQLNTFVCANLIGAAQVYFRTIIWCGTIYPILHVRRHPVVDALKTSMSIRRRINVVGGVRSCGVMGTVECWCECRSRSEPRQCQSLDTFIGDCILQVEYTRVAAAARAVRSLSYFTVSLYAIFARMVHGTYGSIQTNNNIRLALTLIPWGAFYLGHIVYRVSGVYCTLAFRLTHTNCALSMQTRTHTHTDHCYAYPFYHYYYYFILFLSCRARPTQHCSTVLHQNRKSHTLCTVSQRAFSASVLHGIGPRTTDCNQWILANKRTHS